MAGKKNIEKELHWQDILGRQAGSGLTVRQFCAEEGVSEPSFYAWRQRLTKRRGHARSRTTGGRVEEPKNRQEFIPLKLVEATSGLEEGASGLEVIHPLGYRVRVSGKVNVTALQHVLDVLDRRANP